MLEINFPGIEISIPNQLPPGTAPPPQIEAPYTWDGPEEVLATLEHRGPLLPETIAKADRAARQDPNANRRYELTVDHIDDLLDQFNAVRAVERFIESINEVEHERLAA